MTKKTMAKNAKTVKKTGKTAKKTISKKKPKPKAPAKPEGRPTLYTLELGDIICSQIAEGVSLSKICKTNEGMPETRSIYRWLRTEPEFSQNYKNAKEDQADKMVEDMLDIADDGRNDYMDKLGQDGEIAGVQLNTENIQRSRLRVDTRKWAASKFKAKKYGDKIITEHTGSINLTEMTQEELDRALAEAEQDLARSLED